MICRSIFDTIYDFDFNEKFDVTSNTDYTSWIMRAHLWLITWRRD